MNYKYSEFSYVFSIKTHPHQPSTTIHYYDDCMINDYTDAFTCNDIKFDKESSTWSICHNEINLISTYSEEELFQLSTIYDVYRINEVQKEILKLINKEIELTWMYSISTN